MYFQAGKKNTPLKMNWLVEGKNPIQNNVMDGSIWFHKNAGWLKRTQ